MNWTLSATPSKHHPTLYGLQRALSTFSTLPNRRWGIKQTQDDRVIHIPKADVFRFGDTKASDAIFRDLEWAVKDGESWAVIGATPSSKSELFQVSHPTAPNTRRVLTSFYITAFKASTWPTTPQTISPGRDIPLFTPYNQGRSRARCSPARILRATTRQAYIRRRQLYRLYRTLRRALGRGPQDAPAEPTRGVER